LGTRWFVVTTARSDFLIETLKNVTRKMTISKKEGHSRVEGKKHAVFATISRLRVRGSLGKKKKSDVKIKREKTREGGGAQQNTNATENNAPTREAVHGGDIHSRKKWGGGRKNSINANKNTLAILLLQGSTWRGAAVVKTKGRKKRENNRPKEGKDLS